MAEAFVEGLKAAIRATRAASTIRSGKLNEHDRRVANETLEQHAKDLEMLAGAFERTVSPGSRKVVH
ncbi:hypothetical protein [Sphingomonas sp. CFBP 8760]|uniref:hypothetical protein n=1 Tax=Sphingomonas sp. CFBP 8760 TaxID=2775282 RepID=UPI00177FE8F4|nr:hypothetical protein [Sphingomonas sp. CFBP 8760]MBD8549010.1 hypothetical protein [Sphingomonas sp. CFBP 8760]